MASQPSFRGDSSFLGFLSLPMPICDPKREFILVRQLAVCYVEIAGVCLDRFGKNLFSLLLASPSSRAGSSLVFLSGTRMRRYFLWPVVLSINIMQQDFAAHWLGIIGVWNSGSLMFSLAGCSRRVFVCLTDQSFC